MEKLLHERLREVANEYGWFRTGDEEQALQIDFAKALADEIERYYIPRPRFEDGEPMDWNSEDIKWDDGGDYAFNAINDKGIPCALGMNIICAKAEMTDEGYVKRPTPKVYDADGVECKQGEKVWYKNGNYGSRTIRKLLDGGVNLVGDGSQAITWGYEITHERPVFDAEGERICKGDTVWTKYGDKAIVTTIYSDDTKIVEVRIDDALIDYAPNSLTHHEPDSLESIAKYAKDEAVKYAGCIEPLNKVAARLTALIERGA